MVASKAPAASRAAALRARRRWVRCELTTTKPTMMPIIGANNQRMRTSIVWLWSGSVSTSATAIGGTKSASMLRPNVVHMCCEWSGRTQSGEQSLIEVSASLD